MIIKKAGGKIFGASFTAAEKKAMDMEIMRQLVEMDRKYALDLDATLLWYLHARYGFGPRRLKEFYMGFNAFHDEMMKHYEMESSDKAWLCTKKLKDMGIDLEQWSKERGD